MKENIRLFAFDLDGTLTQHKSPLEEKNRQALTALAQKARLCMVGAGMCRRIFDQMGAFPIDIIGNYGMQTAFYDHDKHELVMGLSHTVQADRPAVEKRVWQLRREYGFTSFVGDNVEYHASGCVTIPLLGTAAALPDKLTFDPDRSRRRKILEKVKVLFPEYTVFVGGTSSFDMVPRPFDKYYALDLYCKEHGIAHSEVVYFGDDDGPGGNDEPLFLSDFRCIRVDDYTEFPQLIKEFI